MANWLERARREISQISDRHTANTAERNLSAATSVPQLSESRISKPAARLDSISEGSITAVLIDSPVVGPVWFAFDDNFKSGDDVPVFFASELANLRRMSESELRRRYEQKIALGGGWIRNEIVALTKH
jgi:hypothetical protein